MTNEHEEIKMTKEQQEKEDAADKDMIIRGAALLCSAIVHAARGTGGAAVATAREFFEFIKSGK